MFCVCVDTDIRLVILSKLVCSPLSIYRYLERVFRLCRWKDERESERLGERDPLEPLLGEPLREPLDPLLGDPLSELLGGDSLLLPPLCRLVRSCSSLLPRPQPSLEPFLTKGSCDRDLRGPFSRDASLDLL